MGAIETRRGQRPNCGSKLVESHAADYWQKSLPLDEEFIFHKLQYRSTERCNVRDVLGAEPSKGVRGSRDRGDALRFDAFQRVSRLQPMFFKLTDRVRNVLTPQVVESIVFRLQLWGKNVECLLPWPSAHTKRGECSKVADQDGRRECVNDLHWRVVIFELAPQ